MQRVGPPIGRVGQQDDLVWPVAGQRALHGVSPLPASGSLF